MDYVEVKLVVDNHECIDGIANVFNELGSGGVVIDDPQLIASYAHRGQWDDHEFSEELLAKTEVTIKGYLAKDEFLVGKLEGLRQELRQIEDRLQMAPIKLVLDEVKEEDWANSWKVYFKPDKVGEKTVIKPTWEAYAAQEGELVIEIDPGMAFGTGNHATTALCINLLEKYVTPGMEVLDVGTGSGILAIQAALLGATAVQAMDFDTVAVKAAGENVALNHLEDRVRVAHSDLLAQAQGKGDLIIANIVADIIIRLIPDTAAYLKGPKLFISSGIIDTRKQDVLDALAAGHFEVLEIREKAGWVAIVARYQG